jgi:hypothetical protein
MEIWKNSSEGLNKVNEEKIKKNIFFSNEINETDGEEVKKSLQGLSELTRDIEPDQSDNSDTDSTSESDENKE